MKASEYKLGTKFKNKDTGEYWDIARFPSGKTYLTNKYNGELLEHVDLNLFEASN